MSSPRWRRANALGLVAAGMLITVVIGASSARASPLVITIYNRQGDGAREAADAVGLAVVTERRTLALQEGPNELDVDNLPAELDPTTVHIVDETDPSGTELVRQTFRNDATSADGLLARNLGSPITVTTDQRQISGTLVSYDADTLVVRTGAPGHGELEILSRAKGVRELRFAETAAVTARPTLHWTLLAKKAGTHTIELDYETRGLSFWAEYTAVLSADDKDLDLTGWLSIGNTSGGRFADATVRLIVGDVVRDPAAGETLPRAPTFRQTLAQPITIATSGAQAVQLVAMHSPTGGKRSLVYEHLPRDVGYLSQTQAYPLFEQGADGEPTAQGQLDAYLEVPSSQHAALPPGLVHVFRRQADGTLDLVREEHLPPTPAAGAIQLRIGTAEGVTAEHKQVDFQVDEGAHEMREKIAIELKSARKDAIEVSVVEHMYRWTRWTLEETSSPGKPDPEGQTARFTVKLAPGGQAVLSYTVLYQW